MNEIKLPHPYENITLYMTNQELEYFSKKERPKNFKITCPIETDNLGNEYIINTIVSLNDEPIGMIQKLKFKALAGIMMPAITITFPDVTATDIKYQQEGLAKEMKERFKQLANIMGINIKLKNIFK